MIKQEEVYKIGKLGKPHGVKGEISFLFSDDIFDTTDCDYLVVDIDGILVPFFMEEYRFKGNETALVKFEGVDTQERARDLTGNDVYFPRSIANDNEETSWAEIVGYHLVDASDGKVLGEIRSVDDSTINVLFEIVTVEDREVLIPASEELIRNVDKQEREIVMDIPEGLLDLE